MKIDRSLNPLPGSSIKGSASRSSAAGEKAAAARAPAAPTAPAAPQDSVQLGGLSPNAEASGAPVDTARVDAIKQAISEGRFKVNPEAIADGLISTAKDLMTEHRT